MSNPWSVPFNITVGPDGPWNVLSQAVDYPDQYMLMHPSLSSTSLVIQNSACTLPTSNCPSGSPPLWANDSGATQANGDIYTQSSPFGAVQWDSSITEPMGLRGKGQYIADRMTLHSDNDGADARFLDHSMFTVSNNFTATFPGAADYTLAVGYFSLNAAQDTFSWSNSSGATIEYNRTLTDAYYAAQFPSKSYGLHIGSAEPNVSASLLLGGYDSSRCLTQPIESDNQVVQLVDIGLGVASGSGAYQSGNGSCSGVDGGLLRGSFSGQVINVTQISAMPNPGVPYMYLPKQTCDAIASFLPVTYNAALGLYIWDTAASNYPSLISSPHYLRFSFASGSSTTTDIDVPFALLNLTLQFPIVSVATQYFPCSPYTPSDKSTYHLGRSFLQAAFLAQNWQTGKLWLAQAPGPDYLSPSLKSIQATDTILTAAANLPSWQETWPGLLPLNSSNGIGSQVCSAAANGGEGGGNNASGGGLSGGAVAGIVVGVVAALALVGVVVFYLLKRRRRQRRNGVELDSMTRSPVAQAKHDQYPLDEYARGSYQEAPPESYVTAEMPANDDPAELGTEQRHVQELEGSQTDGIKDNRI